MARVDSLPEGAKELLQIGSVIEREFSYELIKRATGLLEQELLSHLSVLKDSELLYERGIYPETTYIFKHALTREVVYDSILTHRKKTPRKSNSLSGAGRGQGHQIFLFRGGKETVSGSNRISGLPEKVSGYYGI
jgi:hypothetical protein